MPRKPQSYNNTTPVQQFTETAYDAVVICADNIDDIIRSASGAEVMALYLGAHATEPTTNNEGEPLVSGNFYLDTTTSSLKYWDSTNMVWVESDVDTVVTAAQAAIDARDAAQAAQTAAETAESNASTSAGQSASSASQAATSETNSANSATASANSASAASADASAASASATAASNSAAASEASNVSSGTHASNAAASEVNAATSAITASNAAAQAEAAFDNFDDMYLGRKTVPPTTDNDGNPLQVGASYWHDNGDDTGEQRFWNGASWESPELTATQAAQQAVAARDDAQISETNAELYKDAAQASANAAGVDANNAGNSATAAANSAGTASTKAQEASDSADAANVSAGAASTSEGNAAASATVSANSATAAANSATEAANTVAEFDWQKFVRGEAELNQMREQNKAPRAASGFDHYGKHNDNATNIFQVNEGMYAYIAEAGALHMGRDTSGTKIGTSETDFPVTCIAGFVSELLGVNQGFVNTPSSSQIKFPAAPNGTVIYDSSGSVRGTSNPNLNLLTDVDPRYGDVAGSVNEAVARAFEGQSPNFNFRNGSAHWTLFGGADIPADYLIIAGVNSYAHNSLQNVTPDRDYIVEIVCDRDTVTNMDIIIYSSDSTKAANKTQRLYEGLNRIYVNSADFDQNYGSTNIMRIGNVAAIIDSAVVRAVTEEIVLDRHDMYGGEYFLEEVSLANPFVYPKGMIQSQLVSMNGISTTASSRPTTYYAVYDGDTGSVGKGVDFFAATTQQKIDMVSDETNNIFMLSDGRIVQWRMRQRTIAGVSNGDWNNLSPIERNALRLTDYLRLRPQGFKDVAPALTSYDADNYLAAYYRQDLGKSYETGVFQPETDNAALNVGVNGECYFYVWGSVRRLNQGCFHPSFNPLGAAALAWRDSDNGQVTCYSNVAAKLVGCTADAFIESTAGGSKSTNPTTGTIADAFACRDDLRKFDVIYPGGDGGVNDNRLSSYPMDSKEEASKVFQKVVDSTFLGEENLIETGVFDLGTPSDKGTFTGYAQVRVPANTVSSLYEGFGTATSVDNAGHFVDASNNVFAISAVSVDSGGYDTIYFSTALGIHSDDINITGQCFVLPKRYSGSSVSGEFQQIDVVGHPLEIVNNPFLVNGWQGGWISVLPTGSPSHFPYTRKNRGAVDDGTDAVATTDRGATWGDSSVNCSGGIENIFGNSNQSITAQHVYIIPYRAWAKMTRKTSEEKKVLNGKEGVGYVFASEHYNYWTGVHLGESLLDKVLTNSSADYFMGEYSVKNLHGMFSGLLTWTSSDRDAPEHEPITMTAPNNNSPAFKTLWYQTATNQLVNLFLPFNELIWNLKTPIQLVAGQSVTIPAGGWYYLPLTLDYEPNRGRLLRVESEAIMTPANNWWGVNEIFDPVDGSAWNASTGTRVTGIDCITNLVRAAWGDDARLKVKYGSGTYTNRNADECVCGTHELSKPIGYTKNHARVSEQVEGVDL